MIKKLFKKLFIFIKEFLIAIYEVFYIESKYKYTDNSNDK